MATVEGRIVSALGLKAGASAEDVDSALSERRMHAYMCGKLGLPIDATGGQVLAKVDEQMAAAKAAQTRVESRPTPAASTRPAARAPRGDDLPADELAKLDYAAITGRYTTTNGREPGQWSE